MPASLLSAKIRGVRSYSPHEANAQVIDFMPLTLIVGSNGTGKTTIIEALKFIISGEEPPLSDSRRNFIHLGDPRDKSNKPGSAPSYASIELQFQNSADEICIAKREISQIGSGRNVTPSISSSYKIHKGPWKSVHKQDDWNKTMPILFNLPNLAVLNNVVLCHQEDNLWCMGDSSSVKQVFDKIFGCEQYKKEIKNIEAEIKTAKSDLLLGEKDLIHLKDKVEHKKNMLASMDSLHSEITKITADCLSLDKDLAKTIESKMSTQEEIDCIESRLRSVDTMKSKIGELQDRSHRLSRSLRQPMIDKSVSQSELERKLQDHTKFMEQSKVETIKLKGQESTINREIFALDSKKSSIQESINKLKVFELKSQETRKSLIESLQSIKIEQSLDKLDCSDMQTSLKILEDFEKDLMQKKCDQSELDESLSSDQNKLSKNINRLEGNYQGLLHKIMSREKYVKKLTDQLAQADPLARDLVIVAENLKRMSVIASQIPETELVGSLKTLIEQTFSIVDNLVEKVRNDNILTLTKDIDKESSEINESRSALNKMESEKKDLSSELDKIEKMYSCVRTAAKEAHNRVVTFKSAKTNVFSTFDRYQKEQRIVESSDIVFEKKNMKNIEEQLEVKRAEVSEITAKISSLSSQVAQNYEMLDFYKINLQIRDLQTQIDQVQEQLQSLCESSTADKENCARLKNSLVVIQKKELVIRDKRSTLMGRKIQLESELSKIESELKTYSKANAKYAESLGSVVCNKIILGDLDKLKQCFQDSITNFHNQMIVKINEVLKARWRQTYRGEDIDYIELVDEEITRGKDKKAFNYYIAMRKNGHRMKMREKSSAGQKALASIILRMTLAELFVKDYTFIALDEPTANLDLVNVQSLAKAIGAHVKRRTRKGVNMQWIIITHDEQFLKALDAECSPYYYRTRLDENGCSKIVKISFLDSELGSAPSPLEAK